MDAKKWITFILRGLTLIGVSVYYLVTVLIRGETFSYAPIIAIPLGLVWLQFCLETVSKLLGLRFAPIGATKHLARNYRPTGRLKPKKYDWKKTFCIACMWGVAVVFFGVGKFTGFLDEGLLVLAFLSLAVIDSLCVKLFCPFRVFVMKNKCCTTCRIYNWDGLMVASPLYFVFNVWSWILVGLGVVLFVWWEIAYKTHPERFSDETNANLGCAGCKNDACPSKIK